MKKAIFFDRDGVLAIPEFRDGRSYAVKRFENFKLYPEASHCVNRLKSGGFMVFVITNQPDVGSGKVERTEIQKMMRELLIDDLRVCFHTNADRCYCRKPNPGMLLDLIATYDINPLYSFMVGDRSSDIEAGAKAGCRTVFIDLNYTSEEKPKNANFNVNSLTEASDAILNSINIL